MFDRGQADVDQLDPVAGGLPDGGWWRQFANAVRAAQGDGNPGPGRGDRAPGAERNATIMMARDGHHGRQCTNGEEAAAEADKESAQAESGNRPCRMGKDDQREGKHAGDSPGAGQPVRLAAFAELA